MYDKPMQDRLNDMFESQRRLQLLMPPLNRDPAQLEGMERIQFFKDMKLALESELEEMMDEIGWKPWATSRHVHTEAVQGEIIDAWHFLMNLWLATGGDADLFFEKYHKKREKNLQRQQEEGGYDGVSTKCPWCGRALDDDAVACELPSEGRNGYCSPRSLVYTQNDLDIAHGKR